MFQGRRIAVVIPCYNVAAHLEQVVRALPRFVDRIVLVDDGSSDDFAGIAGALHDERVAIERHDRNRGLAAAMVTGFRAALDDRADIIVKMDGDGQMLPDHLPALLAPIAGDQADFTKGNRFVRRRYLEGMPIVRLIGNLALSFLAKVASGYWSLFDPTNGYVALRRELLEAIDTERLGPRYFFEISLLIEAYLAGAVARDVPMPARYGDEVSSLSVRRSLIGFPWLLVKGAARRVLVRYVLRDFSPVALFLMAGAGLMGYGFLFGVWHWMHNYGTGQPTPTGTVILAVVPLLTGFQLALQAVVMDIGNVPQKSPWLTRSDGER